MLQRYILCGKKFFRVRQNVRKSMQKRNPRKAFIANLADKSLSGVIK